MNIIFGCALVVAITLFLVWCDRDPNKRRKSQDTKH